MKSELVDSLFSRLTVAYGTRFRDQWAGQPAHVVKRLWADELRDMPPYRIRWALQNLPPDFPPNAMQFRALCRSAPLRADPVLLLSSSGTPPPPGLLERLQAMRVGGTVLHPKQWAHDLRQREQDGERLTQTQRDCWRMALDSDG